MLSRDFGKERGEYQDEHNLFATYLLYNLARYGLRLNPETQRIEVERRKQPAAYPQAAAMARQSATSDSAKYAQRAAFSPQGTRIGDSADEPHR